MSGKKKQKSGHAKRLETQRKLRARQAERKTIDVALPEDDVAPAPPSPNAVAAYADVVMWTQDDPGAAADLACLHETDWAGPLAGMAFPERFNFPESEVREWAWRFRAWHILNEFWYAMDWTRPIAEMTEDEIIEQLRADGAAGKISLAD